MSTSPKDATTRQWFTAVLWGTGAEVLDGKDVVVATSPDERDERIAEWITEDPTAGPRITRKILWATDAGAERFRATTLMTFREAVTAFGNAMHGQTR